MQTLRLATLTLSLAIFAGCGGSQTVPQSIAHLARAHQSGKSWMLPEAKNEDLLYASAGGTNVLVFSYPRGTLVGTISDFWEAEGICVDSASNVWVVNGYPAELIEYSHGGTVPIGTLSTEETGIGCAVDPISGDLALAHQSPLISIYPKAQGPAVDYTSADFGDLNYVTYDNKGNLFSFGYYGNWPSEQPGLAELPRGADTIETVAIKQDIEAEGIQWDGKYLAVGGYALNHNPVPIYRVVVSGSTAKVVGTTLLTNRQETRVQSQFWIQGNTVIQPSRHNYNLSFWHYPKGGNPARTIKHIGYMQGVAVSLAPSHSRTRH